MIATPSQDLAMLDWAWAGAALDGDESGDAYLVAPLPHGALLAVIDGLGHGPEAAVAAREATSLLQVHPGRPLQELMDVCHEGLRKTRGVVMSLVAFDTRSSTLEWCGVGNVEGVLLRANSVPGRSREAISCRGGVVGYRLPATRVVSVSVSPGDLLVLATDGIRPDFPDSIQQADAPQVIADTLLARCAKVSDDRLVLVARYLGIGQ